MEIFANAAEVESRLTELGISFTGLVNVVGDALGAHQTKTLFHPKSSPGTALWDEGTASVRRLLVGSHGWDYDDLDGQPRTFTADERLAIVVQTGDDATGMLPPYSPSTRHPKGSATKKKVQSNYLQLSMFDTGQPQVVETITWILLLAVVAGELRAELSLPDEMDKAGFVASWRERILLPAIPIDGGEIDVTSEDGDEPPGDIDVAVDWK